jgi:hypothetical protein
VPEGARNDAGDWLRDMLAGGPVKVLDLRREVTASGASWRTIETAKVELGVIAERHSAGNTGGGFWTWRLPGKSATASPQGQSPILAVLPESSNGAGFEGSKSARPQDRKVDEGSGLAAPVRCLDCRHAVLSAVNPEGGLATCGAGHRGAVAAATHTCSSFDGAPA